MIVKVIPLTIIINLLKQININQMLDKIQMVLMMKTSISNNRISRLNKIELTYKMYHDILKNIKSNYWKDFFWKYAVD